MTLTEKDRTELLGLVSGMGTPDSDAHARGLAKTDAEAAAYVRQMRLIAEAFKPPPEEETAEPLSPQETDIILGAVWARAGQKDREQKPQGWTRHLSSRWSVGSVAAALALAAGIGWLALRPRTDRPAEAADAIETLFIPDLRAAGGDMRRRERFRPGDEVVTGPEFARLVLPDRATVVLNKLTGVLIGRRGDSLLLKKGSVLVVSRGAVGVGLGSAESNLSSGTMLLTYGPGKSSWILYEGQARITIGDRSWDLVAGEGADWDPATHVMHTRTGVGAIPSWASRMLEAE